MKIKHILIQALQIPEKPNFLSMKNTEQSFYHGEINMSMKFLLHVS